MMQSDFCLSLVSDFVTKDHCDPLDLFPGVYVCVCVSVMVCVFVCVLRSLQQDISSFQSLSYVQFFATPWTVARQADSSSESLKCVEEACIGLLQFLSSNPLSLCPHLK